MSTRHGHKTLQQQHRFVYGIFLSNMQLRNLLDGIITASSRPYVHHFSRSGKKKKRKTIKEKREDKSRGRDNLTVVLCKTILFNRMTVHGWIVVAQQYPANAHCRRNSSRNISEEITSAD
jgi:hypothetical protein